MKFSIVTISHNSNNYLEKTIKSVLSQADIDLEYILIDGGSTDGTVDIIKNFALSDTRIKWQSEKDDGISDAMNKGIRMATGDIIAHLHSDDFYPHPFVLRKIATVFHAGVKWVTGGMHIVGENDGLILYAEVKPFSYKALLKGNSIYHPSTFLLRSCFYDIGFFDTSLKYAMDYDMWLKLAKSISPILLNEPLSCFRAHSSSISTVGSDNAYTESWRVRKRHLGRNPIKILFEYFRFLNSRKAYNQFNRSLLTIQRDEK